MTLWAKRTQRVNRPRDGAPKYSDVTLEADTIRPAWKAVVACRKPRASHRVGVVERGMFTPGFSKELERPDDFHVKRRGGEAAEPSSRPDEWSRTGPAAGGSKQESGHERKWVRRGTGARPRRTALWDEHQESELLNRTSDGGELKARRTHPRKERSRVMGPRWETRTSLRPWTTCLRN